jgi:hypothetical protein
MSLSQVGGVLEAVLAGLAAAEKQGIVHRDLKPENLLVTESGSVKISDFGIAKATNDAQTGLALTAQGGTVGTPNYMAPEQALGQDVGPWTDLYSLGIIAFEVFIGVTPFSDTEEPLAVLMRQVNEDLPPVNTLDPGIDPRLAGWIDWLVQKEPDERPQSADDAWEGLENTLIDLLGPRWRREAALPVLAGGGPTVPGPATPPPPAAPLGPLTEAHLGTRPSDDDPRLAATIPPQPAEPAPPAPAPAPKPKGRSWTKALFLVVAVVALAAAALARTGGPLTRSAATETSPPAGQAAVQNVQAIQDQGPRGTGLTGQATSAGALARRYDKASSEVAALPSAKVKGSAGARLAKALRETARAYRRAQVAAAAGNVAAYAAALTDVKTAKQRVNAALTEMGGTVPPTTQTPSQQQPAPLGTQPAPAPTPPPAPSCGGDSSSDDPSDDACEA